MEFTPAHMENLMQLLRPPEPEILQGEDLPSAGFDISSTRGKIPHAEDKKTPKTIEEYEEQEAKEIENLGVAATGLGELKTPEYTMNYQQSVSAEDVYLQIGPKTPGSASCENLIVRVNMPGDKKENVDLVVDTTTVTLTSSQYSLKLPLPHEINPDLSKASWDANLETLVLTLKLDREFDFIGPKTPGSASCENLIVRVNMPGDKKENVDLVVDTTTVTLTSSQYSLKLPLPHEINPDLSKASWDANLETLVLTLKLDREFDFVNF